MTSTNPTEDHSMTSSLGCPRCSTTARPGDRFCGGCGHTFPRASSPRPLAETAVGSPRAGHEDGASNPATAPITAGGEQTPPRPPTRQPEAASTSLTTRAQAVPVLMGLIIGLLAVTALAGLIRIAIAPQAADTATTVLLLALSVAFGLLAYRLYLGSRVARALTFTAVLVFLVAALFTPLNSPLSVLLALVCAAAVAPLGIAPSVRKFFAGPFSITPTRATSIILAQILIGLSVAGLALLAVLLIVFGLVILAATSAASDASQGSQLASQIDGAFGGAILVGGVVAAAGAGLWFWAMRALGTGSRVTRILVTIAVAIDLLLLTLTPAESTLAIAMVAHTALIATLWLAPDARQHFGDTPLPIVDDWHRKAIAIGHTATGHNPPGQPNA